MIYDSLIKNLRETDFSDGCPCGAENLCEDNDCLIWQAADAIEELQKKYDETQDALITADLTRVFLEDVLKYIKTLAENYKAHNRWIPVTERLPECDLGAEVGNIEWISCGMVHAGCFGRGGKYRDAYFRTWTDAGEGMDAKDADYWRAVTLPEPPEGGES